MKILIAALAAAVAALASPSVAADDAKKTGATDAAAEIISMRSTLANNFIKPGAVVNEETFKRVCGAVAKRVKELSEKDGLAIRHAAVKYRNPKNAATPEEVEVINRFLKDKDLPSVTSTGTKDGRNFFSITRPIYVEEACLACHGDMDKRPNFIKEKYPDDRAYGFKTWDLRGIITVTEFN